MATEWQSMTDEKKNDDALLNDDFVDDILGLPIRADIKKDGTPHNPFILYKSLDKRVAWQIVYFLSSVLAAAENKKDIPPGVLELTEEMLTQYGKVINKNSSSEEFNIPQLMKNKKSKDVRDEELYRVRTFLDHLIKCYTEFQNSPEMSQEELSRIIFNSNHNFSALILKDEISKSFMQQRLPNFENVLGGVKFKSFFTNITREQIIEQRGPKETAIYMIEDYFENIGGRSTIFKKIKKQDQLFDFKKSIDKKSLKTIFERLLRASGKKPSKQIDDNPIY